MNNKYTNLVMNNSFLVFLESCGGGFIYDENRTVGPITEIFEFKDTKETTLHMLATCLRTGLEDIPLPVVVLSGVL